MDTPHFWDYPNVNNDTEGPESWGRISPAQSAEKQCFYVVLWWNKRRDLSANAFHKCVFLLPFAGQSTCLIQECESDPAFNAVSRVSFLYWLLDFYPELAAPTAVAV